MVLSIFAWLLVGVVAGVLVRKIVNRNKEGFELDVALAVVGAVVGGCIFEVFDHGAPDGVDLYSVLIAMVGAVIVLFVYHTAANSRI